MRLLRTFGLSLVISAVLLSGPPTVEAQSNPRELFEQARMLDESNQNLSEAIALYRQAASLASGEVALAARAQLRVGLLFDRMGQPANARQAYEKVIRTYTDETETVAEARSRINAIEEKTHGTTVNNDDTGIVLRQIWAGSETDAGSPSPDGRYIVYVDWSTGNLAVRDIISETTRPLTTGATWNEPMQYARGGTVSRDQERVAYGWVPDSGDWRIELRLMPFSGGEDRVLYSEPGIEAFSREWSNSGRHVSAQLFDSNGDYTTQIVWISAEDGSVRAFNKFGHPFWSILSHSPDDKYLAYEYPVESDSGRTDIALIATDGSGETTLVEHPANDQLIGWMPDTDFVLFLSDRSGQYDLLAKRVLDGQPNGQQTLIQRSIGQIIPQGFTADGLLFYSVTSRRYTSEIVPWDRESGEIDVSNTRPFLGSYYMPEWSPDDRQIAYVSEVASVKGSGSIESRKLHVRDLATDEDRILAGHLNIRYPRWSPDGKSILVTGYDRNGANGALYSVDVANGIAEQLIKSDRQENQRRLSGAWSDDGNTLVHIIDHKMQSLDLLSNRSTELYFDDDHELGALAVSPDGLHLGFAAGPMILTMPASGGNTLELVRLELEEGDEVTRIVWSRDGTHLIYSIGGWDSEERSTLWRIAANGESNEKLYEFPGFVTSFSINSDENRLAFSTFKQDAELWVMENLPDVLSELSQD